MSNEPSHFIWYELMTTDVEAAAVFYGAVVGWSAGPSGQPGQDYRQWSIAGETIGGLMAIPPDTTGTGMPPVWAGYVNVEDVDASVASLTAAGGAVHMAPWSIPGVGRMALVSDPQGALFYVMAPTGEGRSPSFDPERPGHGAWNELHTIEWRAAMDFYGAQLGWRASDAVDMGPMGAYQLFNDGGGDIGGMFNSAAVPRPMWLYYFRVDDITAAKARVEAAGGAVLDGPSPVPGGGWILRARDPQGALFALTGPNLG